MKLATIISAAALLALPSALSAQTWANWSLPSSCTGDVTGTFGSGTVSFNGPYNGVQSSTLSNFCSNPSYPGYEFTAAGGAGVNYWNAPAGAYGANQPDNASFIQQVQGVNLLPDKSAYVSNGTRTITFSEAVINPWIALISVGDIRRNLWVEYQFDAPFSVLSYNNNPLENPWGVGQYLPLNEGKTLRAMEFSGIVQFTGTFTSLSFTLNTDENWHGFTVGAPEVTVPEPATFGLLAAGLAGLAATARRRRQHHS